MTDNSAVAMFEAHAGEYVALRRRLVPSFDAFYGTAADALGLLGRAPRRVLDLGAGTGLLSALVGERYPDAELVLLDGSAAMLAQARAALGARARLVRADLADDLPLGPWDAVVSALAIHHLEDDAKRELFVRVHAALSPGGLFVNAEQVLAPTPALARAYARWHRCRALAAGAGEREWRAARERMRADRCATVADQLAWLSAAGFADVDCLYKDHLLAVLAARRPV